MINGSIATFQAESLSGAIQCVEIEIVDDEIAEEDEVFSLAVFANRQVPDGTSRVVIIDGETMCCVSQRLNLYRGNINSDSTPTTKYAVTFWGQF